MTAAGSKPYTSRNERATSAATATGVTPHRKPTRWISAPQPVHLARGQIVHRVHQALGPGHPSRRQAVAHARRSACAPRRAGTRGTRAPAAGTCAGPIRAACPGARFGSRAPASSHSNPSGKASNSETTAVSKRCGSSRQASDTAIRSAPARFRVARTSRTRIFIRLRSCSRTTAPIRS